MHRHRRTAAQLVLAGVVVPPALALAGYVVAGKPHVECGDEAATAAFYHVAIPFFVAAGLAGAIVLARLSRAGRWLAVPVGAIALDGLLPGSLHTPAGAVVVALGVAVLVGSIVTAPVTLGLVVATIVLGVRRRDAEPTRGEQRLWTALVAWSVIAALPLVIFLLSLNADPLCFSF